MSVKQVVMAAAGALGGAGEGAYVEDVFSTYLHTGNSSTQTITNGVDLAGEGGLVWIKCRTTAFNNTLFDTERGATKQLFSDSISSQSTEATSLTSFNTDGFTVGGHSNTNLSPRNYASWTFRKSPKFFDVVTYTGNASGLQTISHNLGSTPGVIIIKKTSASQNWAVWHKDLGVNQLALNTTGAAADYWYAAITLVTDSSFRVGVTPDGLNDNGATYVAYLFAHDAGGFGDDGEQNVISCGSYTGNGSSNGPVINLGWEPQWLLVKASSFAGEDWFVVDNMRGFTASTTGGSTVALLPNSSAAESNYFYIQPRATGFQVTDSNGAVNASGATYIYVAIRRGPMKTPESGTEVFDVTSGAGTGAGQRISTGFPVDTTIVKKENGTASWEMWDRLRGPRPYLFTNSTAAEGTAFSSYDQWLVDDMTGFSWAADDGFSNVNGDFVNYSWKRAPGFFDVVAYTGTGVAHTEAHNLGVAPEMMFVKCRSDSAGWGIYHSFLGNTRYIDFSTGSASGSSSFTWNSTSPTSTEFSVGTSNRTNDPGLTYVAYLFATLAGVSKVGSYTGTAANLNVDCGFSSGARFVLIKRTDSTGDWYVWDSARGIVSGNDPYLLLNSTAAENTSTDYIDPLASGFTVTSSAPAALNASGGSYIFLAIA